MAHDDDGATDEVAATSTHQAGMAADHNNSDTISTDHQMDGPLKASAEGAKATGAEPNAGVPETVSTARSTGGSKRWSCRIKIRTEYDKDGQKLKQVGIYGHNFITFITCHNAFMSLHACLMVPISNDRVDGLKLFMQFQLANIC